MSKKISKKEIERQLQEEAEIISKSVDFWVKEIEKTFAEMDRLERNPNANNYQSKMEQTLRRLEHLITKGDHEEQAIINLEKKLCKLLKINDPKELKTLNKKKRKPKK